MEVDKVKEILNTDIKNDKKTCDRCQYEKVFI